MRRWLIISGVLVLVSGILLLGLTSRLKRRVRERAVSTLRDRFDSEVEFRTFHVLMFPRILIWGEGLTLRYKGRADLPPLIQVKKFSAQAGLLELVRKPGRVRSIHLEGLRITVRPRRDKSETPATPTKKEDRPTISVVVDEIVSGNSELDLLPRDPEKPPKTFLIHKLTLNGAGLGQPMSFQARLTNPRPQGEIETRGQFGPWQRDEPGLTPLIGTYTFTNADLAGFRGLAGILSSQGNFKGVLERIEVQGETKTPDFSLRISGHPVSLRTQFHSIVDGTNGNTFLERVRAQILHSSLVANGGVVRTPGAQHRTVFLDVTAVEAKVEDLLRLAVKADRPPMIGLISLKTKLEIPPGEGDIADRLKLSGAFGIGSARFTKLDVQKKVNALSRRGRGEPPSEELGTVVSNLKGRFLLRNGVMTFSNLTFGVPGASVHLSGSYTLRSEELDFRGTLRLQAKLSQTTTGWKSLFLKPVDPWFERGGAGTVLPIRITGTERSPSFGLDVGRVLTRKSR